VNFALTALLLALAHPNRVVATGRRAVVHTVSGCMVERGTLVDDNASLASASELTVGRSAGRQVT